MAISEFLITQSTDFYIIQMLHPHYLFIFPKDQEFQLEILIFYFF